MSEKKIGKLTFIAKSEHKGIRLDENKEVWYNPTKECKEMVQNDLLYKTVELTLIDGKTLFTSIKAVMPEGEPKNPTAPPSNSFEEEKKKGIRLQNAAHCFSRLHVGKVVKPKEAADWCKEFVKELYE